MKEIKMNEHIFIPFMNGVCVSDSRGKLRMYKSERTFDRYSDISFCDAELVEYAPIYKNKNKPLTLSELREMNGEAVWIQFNNETTHFKSHWALVDSRSYYIKLISFDCSCDLYFWLTGMGAKFYRQKPSNNEIGKE